MALERTVSIIKPDAVANNVIGKITSHYEEAGLRVIAAKMLQLSRAKAEGFYGVHKNNTYFNELVTLMISGPIMVQVLEGENAIQLNRQLMGASDPIQADKETIRARFGRSINENAVHGSDSEDTARAEIAFFFSNEDLCERHG